MLLPLVGGCFLITQADIDDRAVPGPPAKGPANLGVWVRTASDMPVESANVYAAGVVSETDKAGIAQLKDVPKGDVLVSVFRDGYTPGFALVDLRGDRGGGAQFTVDKLETGRIHRGDKGGALAQADTWALAFPPEAWLHDGVAPDGAVDVPYSWSAAGSLAPPSLMGAKRTVDEPVPIDLRFAIYVGEAESGGHPLDFNVAATWRVNVPETSDIRDLTDLGLYFFDPTVGFWVERKPGRFETSYLVGSVSETGWWGFASPSTNMGCLTAQLLVDDGGGLAGEVLVTDATRMSSHRVYTDGDGNFCAPVQLGHTLANAFGVDADQSRVFTWATGGEVVSGGTCGQGTCKDNGAPTAFGFPDADGDGYYPFDQPGGDCDDNNSTVNPAADDERFDGIDDNCDGVDGIDLDRDTYVKEDDCDDRDPSAHPNGVEVCDGADNDCNDIVDDDPSQAITVNALGCHPCRAQATIDLGPVLYWTLDDTTGYVLDSSGWGRDGLWGAPFHSFYDGIAQGDAKTPLWEGRLEQYAYLEEFDDFPTDEVSVSIWWKPRYQERSVVSYYIPVAAAPDSRSCVLNDVSSRNELLLQPTQNGTLLAIGDVEHVFDRLSPVDTWSHIVSTWRGDTGEVELYVNNVRVFSAHLECGTDTGLPPVVDDIELVSDGGLLLGQDQDCLGGCTDGYQSYEGLLDEFAIFDRVLNEDEVSVIYLSTTCGEGAQVCNSLDDDGDGAVDEHLLGTDVCPAVVDPLGEDPCHDILENGADRGNGDYWIDPDGNGAFLAYCDGMPQNPEAHYCGDGVLFSPLETCDPPGYDCNDACATIATGYRSCAEILENDPYTATSGPYVVDPTGLGLEELTVVCDMEGGNDGGGWTLVHRLDTGPNLIFADEAEALSHNANDPFSLKYSILDRLEEFRGDTGFAGFDFMMRWPWTSDNAVEIWKQSSNPTIDQDVEGFSVIQGGLDPTFIGLEFHNRGNACLDAYGNNPTLLDGTSQACSTVLNYAVGLLVPQTDTSYGLPGRPGLGGVQTDGSTKEVQLWVRPSE